MMSTTAKLTASYPFDGSDGPGFQLVLPLGDSFSGSPPPHSVVQEKYILSYLEGLGVRPTPATAAVVAQYAPLPPSLVSLHLASHGFNHNELCIRAPSPSLDAAVQKPLMSKKTLCRLKAGIRTSRECQQAQQQINTVKAGDSITTDEAMASAARRSGGGSLGAAGGEAAANSQALFVHCATASKATCLQPFKFRKRLADASKQQQRRALSAALVSSQRRDLDVSPREPHAVCAAGCEPQMDCTMTQDALNELAEEFAPTIESLQQAQEAFGASLVAWFRGLSEVARGGLTSQQVDHAVDLLTQERVMQVLVTLLFWLHNEFVASSPDCPTHLRRAIDHSGHPALGNRARAGARLRHRGNGRQVEAVVKIEQLDLGMLLQHQLMQKHIASARDPTLAAFPNASAAMGLGVSGQSTSGSTYGGSMQSSVCCKGSFVQADGSTVCRSILRQPSPTRQSSRGLLFQESDLPGTKGVQLGSLKPSGSSSSRSVSSTSSMASLAAAMQASGEALSLAAAVPSMSTDSIPLNLQQARLVGLLTAWRALESECRDKGTTDMAFSLPVVLLALRSTVQFVFVNTYQSWQRTFNGAQALSQIQCNLVELLDPCGFHSSLPILSSTPAAMELSRRYSRTAHGIKSHHISNTSSRVKAALGEAASPSARKLLRHLEIGHRSDPSLLQLCGRLNAAGSAQLLPL